MPPAVRAIARRTEPTCSISQTSTAASTPIVASGGATSARAGAASGCPWHRSLQACGLVGSSAGLELAQLLKSCADGMASHVVRVAAVGDLHCAKTSQGAFQALF